ncbi:Fe-S cluster assembly protein HesB [Phytoactinopolyspora mesophila]|uniref:Fe-S cluster assembly protein HesB n=1 Tax=Phytoactinopolyspora mesophila TaxID=2650750 RepID=A0A7K3MA41_9ACTN|nr:Fe-S cluster assembly protein HesB [Phytoactinopolyspora mesophila]NDL59268.1 Fe-S cluster assembly protein HesB [Phytoactinopolyspora mesophila]
MDSKTTPWGQRMLALTEQAATAIRNLSTQAGDTEEMGLRIAATTTDDGSRTFALSMTDQPEAQDQVIEAGGARVIMDAGAAQELNDKALDAEIGQQGEVQFVLAEQSA